ncbi:MAG: DHA1 family inner membrane transport protein [Paraglaciecola sp.]|jgi:DHA1 family inner membrane transport protein
MSQENLESKLFNVNNNYTVASVVICSAVAILGLLIGPLLIGEYVSVLDISSAQAGFILSAEMFGLTLGSLIIITVLNKNWQSIVKISLSLMILGNFLSLYVYEPYIFILCRFVTGFGAGMLMTMTIQVIGLMRFPDKIYALWTAVQLFVGALAMMFFSTIVKYGGLDAIFVIWSVLTASLYVSIKFYPSSREVCLLIDSHEKAYEKSKKQWSKKSYQLGILSLIGLFIYYSGQTGVWVYLERIGTSWDISPEQVANVLFFSLIIGILASVIVMLLGDKFGRTLPITFSMIIAALSIIILMQESNIYLFTLATCLFNFAWYFFLPYICSVISTLDNDGRLLTGLSVTFPAALAAGPAIVAILIGHGGVLLPCMLFGLFATILGYFLMLPSTRIK